MSPKNSLLRAYMACEEEWCGTQAVGTAEEEVGEEGVRGCEQKEEGP